MPVCPFCSLSPSCCLILVSLCSYCIWWWYWSSKKLQPQGDEDKVFSVKGFMLLPGISLSSDLRELSAGDCFCRCLAAEELLLEACCGVLCATDYFLWRKRWKHTRRCCLYFIWCCLSAVMTDAFKTQTISCTKEHYCGCCVKYPKDRKCQNWDCPGKLNSALLLSTLWHCNYIGPQPH